VKLLPFHRVPLVRLRTVPLTRWLRAICLLLCCAFAGEAAHAALPDTLRAQLLASERIEKRVIDRLDASAASRVDVIIELEEPRPRGLRARSEAARRRAIAADCQALLSRLTPGEFLPGRQLRELPVLSGRATRQAVAELAALPGVRAVALDSAVHPHLAQSIPLTGLDRVHREGFLGNEISVAILDTGVDIDHPDLADAIVAEQCFCRGGCCPNRRSEQSGPGAANDGGGHGTQVAGALLSSGVVSAPGGAPGAALVAVKVLPDNGGGSFMDVLAGLDWVRTQAHEVDVVNLSLGGRVLYDDACDRPGSLQSLENGLLSKSVAALREAGVLVVASAGNDGSSTQVTTPACIGDVIAVGAVWDADVGRRSDLGCTDRSTAADRVPCWSNSGSEVDLWAPGGLVRTDRSGGSTTSVVGTSFAAPHVAACAALLIEAAPELDLDSVTAALRTSPTLVTDAKSALTRPRLDCDAALAALPEPALGGTLAVLTTLAALCRARRRYCERGSAGSGAAGSR